MRAPWELAEKDDMCDYERERVRRMRRNQMVVHSLGLMGALLGTEFAYDYGE
jgi:hypothetical protein